MRKEVKIGIVIGVTGVAVATFAKKAVNGPVLPEDEPCSDYQPRKIEEPPYNPEHVLGIGA